MKIPGLCFLLVLGMSSVAGAQTEKHDTTPKLTVDRASIQEWWSRAPQLDRNNVIVSDDDDQTLTCAFMRTYRVKRAARDSDAVRGAGYTTCVPTSRMTLKSAVEIKAEPER